MTKRVMGVCSVFMILSLVLAPQAYGVTALDTVQEKVSEVLNVLRDPALQVESAKEVKEKKLWAIADAMFDYSELSRRTLGANWEKLDSSQQKEFTDLFSTHLGNVYMDRIVAYTEEKVVFDKEKRKGERALVYSRVITRTKEIPIDYRVILRDGEWKVYDVVIEGVSLVENYRSQFREMLRKETPEYLLQTLREKVESRPT
jgi:phospholipid transport system substrate-binding protein